MALDADQQRGAMATIAAWRADPGGPWRVPRAGRRGLPSSTARRGPTRSGMRSPAPLADWTRRSISLGSAGLRRHDVLPLTQPSPAGGIGRSGRRMNIDGKSYRTIWLASDGWSVDIIDQTRLPHELAILTLKTLDDAAQAILTMQVRGAPLIGATAAYGVCLRCARTPRRGPRPRHRPFWPSSGRPPSTCAGRSMRCAPPSATCRAARAAAAYAARGRDRRRRRRDQPRHRQHGAKLIAAAAVRKKPGEPVNILTHCNAGWLACVDVGTATAPIYEAHDRGSRCTCGWTRPARAIRAPR